MEKPDGRSLLFANEFAISCGTVSVDTAQSKVLLIRCLGTGEYLLPKGRKDVGESLEQTATRETFEETGIPVHLLPVRMETKATLPASQRQHEHTALVTEPFALTQRFKDGVLKVIFWYVAGGDSGAAKVEGTQDEDEDFATCWVPLDELEATLSFDDDYRIAREAIRAVEQGPTMTA